MTGWPCGASPGSSQLLFPDQPEDSAQAFVADNIGLTHGDGFVVSNLVLQNPYSGTQFDTTSRRTHTAVSEAQVALAALREDRTMPELCEKFELHPSQTAEWKRQVLERAAEVFDTGTRPEPVNPAPLHAKIGQLTLETNFFDGALTKAGLLSAKP